MPIRLGSGGISGLYVGSTAISRAYVGETMVFDGAGVAEITFVGAAVVNGGGNTIAWPSGTQAGDMATLAVAGTAAPSWSDLSGWTTDVNGGTVNGGSAIYAYSKAALAAGDISSPPSYSGATSGGYCVVVFRGGSAINKKTHVFNATGDTAAVPGFTKAANSSRVLTILCDRNAGGSATVPTGFTQRVVDSITFFTFGAADLASGDYTDDATIEWTGLGTGFNQAAVSWEMT